MALILAIILAITSANTTYALSAGQEQQAITLLTAYGLLLRSTLVVRATNASTK